MALEQVQHKYAIWILIRIPLLLAVGAAWLWGLYTRSIDPVIVACALCLSCAFLDAWVLRVRHIAAPGRLRFFEVFDRWEPPAGMAWCAQVAHISDSSALEHALLAGLGASTLAVIYISRRLYP